MRGASVCLGCGAPFAPSTGPTHLYMSASPACWACFNASMALHYSDPRFWPAHQMLTDAYALQHSQGPDPRARRSAVLHLVALHAQCARDLPHDRVVALRQAIAAERLASERFAAERFGEPFSPWPRASVTIRDVSTEDGPGAHLESVLAFGRDVHADWRPHHDFAEGLCARFLDP